MYPLSNSHEPRVNKLEEMKWVPWSCEKMKWGRFLDWFVGFWQVGREIGQRNFVVVTFTYYWCRSWTWSLKNILVAGACTVCQKMYGASCWQNLMREYYRWSFTGRLLKIWIWFTYSFVKSWHKLMLLTLLQTIDFSSRTGLCLVKKYGVPTDT